MWVAQLPPRTSMDETCLWVVAPRTLFTLDEIVSVVPMPSCHSGLLIGLSFLRCFSLQPVVMRLVRGAGLLLLG